MYIFHPSSAYLAHPREDEKAEAGVLRRVYGSPHSRYYGAIGLNWPGGERKGGGE